MLVNMPLPWTLHLLLSVACYLGMLVALVAILRQRDMWVNLVWMALISLSSMLVYVLLSAPDVALTEASIGACFSTLLWLMVLARKEIRGSNMAPAAPRRCTAAWIGTACVAGGLAALGWIMGSILQDLPAYGAHHTAPHTHVARHYLEHTQTEIGIPNMVTAVLASYRGFDTFGEVYVIATGALCVLLLLQ